MENQSKSYNALGLEGTSGGHLVLKTQRSPCSNSGNFKDRTDFEAASGCRVSQPRELQFCKDTGSSAFLVCNPPALSDRSHDEKLLPVTQSKCLLGKCVSVPLPLHTSLKWLHLLYNLPLGIKVHTENAACCRVQWQ